MRSLIICFTAFLLLWPAQGLSQAQPAAGPDATTPVEAKPKTQAPETAPPPPPEKVPAPPAQKSPSAQAQPSDNGQWVYTDQYGWVWMPFGDDYVYTPPDDDAEPYAYLYYPDHGWVWLTAPWVWGVGPLPFFGAHGPWRFHWDRGPGYHQRAPDRPVFRNYGHIGGGRGGHGRR
jgi:hypothetical protein